MRSSEPTLRLMAVALAVTACAVDLDPTTRTKPHDAAAPPLLPGCALFRDPARGVLGALGAARSLPEPGGGSLWVVDALRVTDAGGGERRIDGALVHVSAAATSASCFADGLPDPTTIGPALDVSDFGGEPLATPLALVDAGGERWLYVSLARPAPGEPFGVHGLGIGVAKFDAARDRFVPLPDPLWTSDRPSFGGAALADGGFVYVYGCKSGGFLQTDCFVARTPVASVSDSSAYEYDHGGGNWTPELDNAWRTAIAGDPVAVLRDAPRSRYLMAYVTPLGTNLSVRSGLGAAGPWSHAVEAARCAVPDGAFCAGVAAHREVAVPDGAVALSYGSATLGWPALDPDEAATRLVALKWPGELP